MISENLLDEIKQKIIAAGVDESLLTELRTEYQKIHFTYCNDDDIPNNEPIVCAEDFNLYLIDGRDHCLCLTNDKENATGIVIAEIYQD